MADYVVTLTGKDNLSNTVKSVKKELEGVGSSAQKLDKVSAQFDKITKSSMPLNRQVRETSKLLSQMKFDGDFNAAQFLKMAKEAGKAKDAVGDTQAIIKAFADDNFALNSVVQGVQGIAAAGSVATGTMALFGVESETAAEAIRKVQGALAILNGLQTIANVLNKDSYVSIARKVIALKAEAVATDKATASQSRLNLAVLANPYVAAAAAIAALAAGIYVLTKNSDDATKAQEELQKSADNFKQAQDRENATLAESVTKFKSLQAQWNSLAGDLNGKKKFIVENKTEFENLGIKVNDVTDAESVFGRNANAIIAAMRARARAAAAYATMVDNLKDQYAKLGEVERKIKNGESFTESDLKDIGILNPDAMAGLREDLTLKSFFGGEKSYTVFGKNAADLIMDAATVRAEQRADELNKTLEKEAEKALKIANETPFYSTSGKGGNKPTKPTKSPKPTTTPKDDAKTVKGLIGQYEADIEKLKKEINEATDAATIKDKVGKLLEKEKEYFQFKVSVGLEIDPELKNQEEAKNKLEEALQENFNNGVELEVAYDARPSVNSNYGQSSFDKAVGNGIDRNSLDGIQTMMDYNDSLIEQLQGLASAYEQLGQTGGDAYKGIIEMLKNLKKEQSELGGKAGGIVKVNEDAKNAEDVKKAWMNTTDALGSSFSALGSIFKETGDSATAAVMQMVAVTLQGVSQIIPQIMALIGAKQAEAMASGTASAASLPFPANIGAIASITATILATFASILSATKGFAEGGIIGGTSYRGDKLLARVNSGEMVLNKRQQSNLFNAINSGNIGGGTVSSVSFRLRGSDIYGALKNYSAIKGKSGINTGIS